MQINEKLQEHTCKSICDN